VIIYHLPPIKGTRNSCWYNWPGAKRLAQCEENPQHTAISSLGAPSLQQNPPKTKSLPLKNDAPRFLSTFFLKQCLFRGHANLVSGFNPLKKIVKLGIFPQIGMKIKNIRNHHLVLTSEDHLCLPSSFEDFWCCSYAQRKSSWESFLRNRIGVKVFELPPPNYSKMDGFGDTTILDLC